MKSKMNKLEEIRIKSFVTTISDQSAHTVKGAGLSLVLCEGGISLVSCRPDPSNVE
ncbi:MAG: pinensin family lanthipeptide [Bacteroidota bacterium]